MTTQQAALKLYRDAEDGAGREGSRKRWRLASHALAMHTTAPMALQAYAKACETHKRADWREAARALATAIDATLARPATVKPEPRGATLIEYLAASGGLRDEGGELGAMDAQLWHRDRAFRPRLIKPDGLALDYACDLAWERGYFDHVANPAWDSADNMHAVTPTMLLDAIRAELAGRPRYAGVIVDPAYDDEELWSEAYPEQVAA